MTVTSHFEIEFNNRTTARSRDQRGRLILGCVAVAINRVNESTYRITYVYTLPLLRRNGYGTIAIAWLCQLADQYQIRLELCPVCLEQSGPDIVKLTAWYQSLGFYRIGLCDEMIRHPKRAYVERNHHEKEVPYLVQ